MRWVSASLSWVLGAVPFCFLRTALRSPVPVPLSSATATSCLTAVIYWVPVVGAKRTVVTDPCPYSIYIYIYIYILYIYIFFFFSFFPGML